MVLESHFSVQLSLTHAEQFGGIGTAPCQLDYWSEKKCTFWKTLVPLQTPLYINTLELKMSIKEFKFQHFMENLLGSFNSVTWKVYFCKE